jgi:phosphoserine phosphatase
MTEPLPSWRDTPTRAAIVSFVETTSRDVPVEERVAVFDNDGTLWCEKPMQPEIGFLLERLAAMVEADPSLGERQPWKAAHERDLAWLGGAITKHYQGDDSDVQLLMAGVIQAYAGWTVEAYAEEAGAYLRERTHPTLGRALRDCGYQPMIELLRYLEANGFACYIASGGNRDFMRTITHDMYGIPPERIIGSSNGLRFQEDGAEGGSIVYLAEADVFDDGPVKPIRIWSRTGRRPIVAGGNSNGDIPMLHYAGGRDRPALRLLVLHDDPDREFDYTAGAEESLEAAAARGWTVVSIKDDWRTVFADAPA